MGGAEVCGKVFRGDSTNAPNGHADKLRGGTAATGCVCNKKRDVVVAGMREEFGLEGGGSLSKGV